MERACVRCGKSFTAQRSTAQYCSASCRVRASQVRKIKGNVLDLPQIAAESVDSSGLVAAVERQLRNADKLETTAGQQAHFLAQRLANSTGDNASGVASLSKELDRLMGVLLADVKQKPDALDEIQGKVLQMRSSRRA